MILKVGDKVKVRDDLEVGMSSNDTNEVIVEMLWYSGKVAFITEILDEGKTYCIDCDANEWYWPDIALNPLVKTNADFFRMMSDDELSRLISSDEWSCICPMCGYNHTTNCMYDDEAIHTKEQCIKGTLEWLKQPYEIL